ncbi:hypothetical protein [Paraburkholderia elongata]|uniref:Uncharacterized protein n=1 Tax=Paraburkholderia elongata TaxID=2675747 RepID=A0A972NQZ7_9BURK|nr:hypothetical protein [Paraburkholderia elongata]NPT58128.1 hypothetical protein [Paraburkholderia elongata]
MYRLTHTTRAGGHTNKYTFSHTGDTMPALKQFTVVDPTDRLNIGLKLSTRTAIEQYRLFYTQSYGHPVERGELMEEVLRSFFDNDADFQKYVKRMSTADKAAVDKALGLARQPGGISDTLISDEA